MRRTNVTRKVVRYDAPIVQEKDSFRRIYFRPGCKLNKSQIYPIAGFNFQIILGFRQLSSFSSFYGIDIKIRVYFVYFLYFWYLALRKKEVLFPQFVASTSKPHRYASNPTSVTRDKYRIMYKLAVCSDGMTEAQPRSLRQNRSASEYIIWHNAHSPANRCSGCSHTCTWKRKKCSLVTICSAQKTDSGSCYLNNQAWLGWNWPTSVAHATLL